MGTGTNTADSQGFYGKDWQDSTQAHHPLLPLAERSSFESAIEGKPPHAVHRLHRRRLYFLVAATFALLCLATLRIFPQPRPVLQANEPQTAAADYRETRIWKSRLFSEGHLLKTLDIPVETLREANVTQTDAALHSVVIDEDGRGNPWEAQVRVFFGAWDYPFSNDPHLSCARVLLGEDYHRTFKLRFWPDPLDHTKVIEAEFAYQWTHEMGFRLPTGALVLPTGRSDLKIAGELSVLLGETVVGTFPFILGQEARPASHLQICMKPFFGDTDYGRLLEWREHHRLLGFDTVHFAGRQAELSTLVDRLNAATGGHDTFRWKPRFQNVTPHDWWDESMLFDECYVTNRRTADWIGVWDLDEFLAPLPDLPWTARWLKDWLAKLGPEIGSIAMPMTWVDQARFGKIPNAKLAQIDKSLSTAELADISRLKQNADGIMEWHNVTFYKSLHKTTGQFAADVHHGWPAPPIKLDPLGVVIYHARGSQEVFPREGYMSYPLTSNVVDFWKRLVHRLMDVSA